MTLADFNNSTRELRQRINDDSNLTRSKFFKFNIDSRTNSFGVWNIMTRNTVAYVNPTKKVVYVRRNSHYADAISAIKGWTVVKSDNMARHERRRSHNEWYVQYYAVPQKRDINLITEQTEYVLDLGHDPELRQNILEYIMIRAYRDSDIATLRDYHTRANGTYPRRRVTFTLGPITVAEPTADRPQADIVLESMIDFTTNQRVTREVTRADAVVAPALTSAEMAEAVDSLRNGDTSPFGYTMSRPVFSEATTYTTPLDQGEVDSLPVW